MYQNGLSYIIRYDLEGFSRSLLSKQCWPRSDCSNWSNLNSVNTFYIQDRITLLPLFPLVEGHLNQYYDFCLNVYANILKAKIILFGKGKRFFSESGHMIFKQTFDSFTHYLTSGSGLIYKMKFCSMLYCTTLGSAL